MTAHDLQRVVLETTATRDRAEALLEGLLRAQSESEREQARLNRVDQLKELTGRSSMDNAIESTRRMIETLNQTIQRTRVDVVIRPRATMIVSALGAD